VFIDSRQDPILITMPSVVSGDLFHCALFGQMVSAFGLNAYVTSALRLRDAGGVLG
jgi:hypothetical protein